jgi:tetratricopeptide (TPR) repeat protein
MRGCGQWNFAWLVGLGLSAGFGPAPARSSEVQLLQQRWFEARTAHFHIYSCGAPQEVNGLAARLEQFCEAYTLLAGAKAVASPPIVVMAFPDPESIKPFLPLYQGRPANLSGFFKRGSDENLIVLALPPTNSAFTGMDVIFHEYAHLLFRHNARIWPLWLNEGMADVYSTFETTGYTVRIGKPIQPYLRLLARERLLPLADLFAVTRDSPQYNERERQGIFYAQSWLLTHYLMAGGELTYQARFGLFTKLLREGQFPDQAFTNALRTTLPTMDGELRRYLERGSFAPIQWAVPMNLVSPKALTTRAIAPVETSCRLGDVLFRIGRLDAAESYFAQARKLAPASPLPYEGLGLLAAERERPSQAVRDLKEALQRGSTSFLAWFTYAREKYRLTAESGNRYAPLPKTAAMEIRSSLKKSIALMPNFAPAHQLLGFFETVQGEDLAAAEQHLQLAIQLEPENPSYLISLAQVQFRKRDPGTARRTLEPLLLPNADVNLRQHAEELIQEVGRNRSGK